MKEKIVFVLPSERRLDPASPTPTPNDNQPKDLDPNRIRQRWLDEARSHR